MKYFANLTTVEAIKAHYRKLAMQYHPDKGGNPETIASINAQYQEALKACNGQSSGDKHYQYKPDIEQELMDKLQELIKLDGLKLALIGYWLWVSGNTKPHKDVLKEASLKWHSKRQCWYYKPKDWKKSRRSDGDLQELAAKYGYQEFSKRHKYLTK